jgi:hypothetical protein
MQPQPASLVKIVSPIGPNPRRYVNQAPERTASTTCSVVDGEGLNTRPRTQTGMSSRRSSSESGSKNFVMLYLPMLAACLTQSKVLSSDMTFASEPGLR